MRTGTVSYKLEDLKKGVIIPIGFVGENDFTKVFFDAEEIYKKYPSASVSMKVQPPKGGIYPATVTRDGNTVIWQVKEADVANRGGGELQLTFTDGETKIKTYIAKTDVKRSLAGNGPAPDPVQDWIDDAEDVLEEVEAAEIHQPIIGLDGYWYTWNQETGEYEKTNTKAQGADGHSPVLTSSKDGKTTTLYADGEQIAQIQDGEDGQGADVIDDTAGEGDTDKTWSADKLADEFGDVLTAIHGLEDANIRYSSLLGENNAQNIEYMGGSGELTVVKFNTKANAQYVISIKLKQAVSKTFYYAVYQPDGTLIGYSSGILAGDTEGVKTITIPGDYIGAYVNVACAVDCVVESIKVISYSNLINEIAEAFVGENITELTYTATNGKQINGSGEVADISDTTYYVTDEIEIIGNRWYQIMAASGYSSTYYVIYDKDHNIIDYMRSPGGSAIPIVNKMLFTPINAKYMRIAYITNVAVAHIALCNTLKPRTTRKPEWLDKFLKISYSSLGVAATNSLETYLSAGHFGFNACKGDVRPTYDGKLIMCHDPGFTFDVNGRITTYNASSRTLIHSLTHAQCMELEYDERNTATENNHYQKVADIDGYLDVCKQYDMIAFITVRDEYISDVVNEVIAALKRHNMTERAIINGYTVGTNCYFRFLNDAIPISFVQIDDVNITDAIINRIKPYGNAIITGVSSTIQTYLTEQKTQIEKAKANGVYVMIAQPNTMEDVYFVRALGISGAQIGTPCLPYSMGQVKFKVNLLNGTPSIVEYKDIQTIDAILSASGNVISISEFTIPGSTRGFPDLIMEYWMNRFAKRITVESENGNTVSAKWQNNALKITVADISVNDTIDVIVEV